MLLKGFQDAFSAITLNFVDLRSWFNKEQSR